MNQSFKLLFSFNMSITIITIIILTTILLDKDDITTILFGEYVPLDRLNIVSKMFIFISWKYHNLQDCQCWSFRRLTYHNSDKITKHICSNYNVNVDEILYTDHLYNFEKIEVLSFVFKHIQNNEQKIQISQYLLRNL